MSEESLTEILSQSDLLLDCSDQFSTRLAGAKAAFINGIPHIFGGAVRFDGQMATFMAGVEGYENSACFACLFSEDAGVKQAPNCSQAGILAPITSLIGTLQALETIKWITKAGTLNSDKLLLFDGLTGSFTSIQISKKNQCSICSN